MRRWLFTVCAAVAIVAQIVTALAPLTEGLEGRMASHVESRGAPVHFLHNEATCAACQARSIQGTTSRPALALAAHAFTPRAPIAGAERAVSFDLNPQHNPRAPPRVI